jgi:hypothetical protein
MPLVLIFGLFTFVLSYLPVPLFLFVLLLYAVVGFYVALYVIAELYRKWYAWTKAPYIPSRPRNWE